MKKMNSLITRKALRNFFALAFLFGSMYQLQAQTDTLHLYYVQVQTKLQDSSAAKIDKWVKKLNGQHVDIEVVAYYSKPEFKKYSQQRCDDLFLILNRKARSLITITFIGPKKGENSQRSTVDVIYKPTVSEAEAKAAADKAAAEKAAKKEAEKAAAAEKASKEKKEKAETASKDKGEKGEKAEKSGKSKTEVAEEQTEKGDKKKESKGKKDEKEGDKPEEDDADYGQASSLTFNEGYSMTAEELAFIKSSKLIVSQTGKKELDDHLYDAVKKFWDFTSNVEQLPYDEAKKNLKANKNEKAVIMSFVQVRTWFEESHGPLKVKILYIGYALSIENAKGKSIIKQFVPKAKGKAPDAICFAFGVSFLNNLCKVMDENKLPKSTKADVIYDLAAPELKDRTLMLSEQQMHKDFPPQELPKYYTSPTKIVSQADWEDAILNKKNVAYVMVVPIPRPPRGYWHYLMDAKTGKVYFYDYGPKVQMNAGWGTGSFHPSQSGFVDKSNFERYESGINKAIEDNKDRAESKAKKDAKAAEKQAKDDEKAVKKDKEKEEKASKSKEKAEGESAEKEKDKKKDKDEEKAKEEKEEKKEDSKKESKKGKKGKDEEVKKEDEKKEEEKKEEEKKGE